jgi:soluble lytic murein transglycosylase-like protein
VKSTGCVAVLFLGALCLLRPAWANIYVFTAEDGTVSLSNVPVDSRYKLVVATDGETGEGRPGNAAWNSSSKTRFEKIINEVADTYGVDQALLHAVITVESGYRPSAVSRKGASGLMQLMPETARRYGVEDSFDPVQNLHGGAKYLRDLLKLFNSDVSLALAAYNAGESAVLKHGRRIPPFRETILYVPKVLAFYKKYQIRL